MSERDRRRRLAVGAGTSPADPDGRPVTSPFDGDVDVDVVQAVAALVSDLVEVGDDAVDAAAPEPLGTGQHDLAEGPGRGGSAVDPTAR